MLKAIILAAWAVAGVAGHAKLRLQGERAAQLQKQQEGPQHRLRVCNAYPYMTALNVFIGRPSGLHRITTPAMAYKTCREFDEKIQAGDKIDFRFQEASAGTFVVGDLPNSDAVLMLVVYRHSAKSTAVAFESHVFANLLNAQIAVLDTYKGPSKSKDLKSEIKIQDLEDATTSRSESLPLNSVVALNAGKYEIVLAGSDGATKSHTNLTVENRQSCVVIRCGVEPEQGRAYAQELMVYPVNPPSGGAARSSARGRVGSSLMALLALLALISIAGTTA
jgi:hypothetical protein